MCTLQVKNGVTLGETYLNDKRREFIERISEVMEHETRDMMNNARPRFFSLIGDCATDSSNKDLEILFARMLCNGEPVNKYLKIVELPYGTSDGVITRFGWFQFAQMELQCIRVFATVLWQSLTSLYRGYWGFIVLHIIWSWPFLMV